MKEYDLKRAIKLINEEKSLIESASLGMHEDWFWTAEAVYEDGKFCDNITDNRFGGIVGSMWATPTLAIDYIDGRTRMIPCYTGESDGVRPCLPTLGVLSGPAQCSIPPLEDE